MRARRLGRGPTASRARGTQLEDLPSRRVTACRLCPVTLGRRGHRRRGPGSATPVARRRHAFAISDFRSYWRGRASGI
eukprot:11173519-Lingulodinium_polyedra.AAC.1